MSMTIFFSIYLKKPKKHHYYYVIGYTCMKLVNAHGEK